VFFKRSGVVQVGEWWLARRFFGFDRLTMRKGQSGRTRAFIPALRRPIRRRACGSAFGASSAPTSAFERMEPLWMTNSSPVEDRLAGRMLTREESQALRHDMKERRLVREHPESTVIRRLNAGPANVQSTAS
jgi:hypothetical protein